MKLKSKKSALLMSFTSLLICFAMLVGSTFAWFTDTASTGVNKIVSGTLDVELWDDTEDKKLSEEPLKWIKAQGHENEEVLWEPGCRYNLEGFRIKNNGKLALKYKIQITGIVGDNELKDAVDFTYKIGNDTLNLNEEGHLKAGEISEVISINGEMKKSAGNEYQNKSIDGITITVYATQDTVENDSYDDQYDKDATYYPVLDAAGLKDALVNGGNITIAGDFTGDATKTGAGDRLTIKTPTTLNFEGVYTVPGSLEASDNWAALYINDETTINAIDGAGIICEDKTDSSAAYIGGPFVADVNAPGKTVTVNGGTYYGGGTTFQVTKGTLVVNGGFFKCAPDINTNDYRYLLNCIDANYNNGSANIIVYGGTFVNFNPADNAAEGAGTNFVAEGYSVISETKENGDVWYTVVEGIAVSSSEELTAVLTGTETVDTVTFVKSTTEAIKLENTAPVKLKGITFKASEGVSIHGLQLAGAKNAMVTLEDITFEGIDFTEQVVIGQNTAAYGLSKCTNITFDGCKFDLSTSTERYPDAIKRSMVTVTGTISEKEVVAYMDGLTVKNCEFDNVRYGVFAGRVRNTTVENCTFTNCANYAIHFDDVAGKLNIIGNTVNKAQGALEIANVGNNYATTDIQTDVTIKDNKATDMTCENGDVFMTNRDNARADGKSTYTLSGNTCTYTQTFAEEPLIGFRIKTTYGPSKAEFIEQQ